MRITDINPTKKGRWSIYIDGEFYGVLHADVYVRSHLAAGDEVTEADLQELMERSAQVITRERALNLLASRAYPAQTLYEKLAAYTDEQSAAEAVYRMQELGLVDDHDYAQRYAADCVNLKGYSYSRTRQALREKGIARDIIDDVMGQMNEEDEVLIARSILRRYSRYLATEAGQKKILDALQRRGFYYGAVRNVLENLQEDASYYDDLDEH